MKKNPFILVYRMKGFFCFYLHFIVKGATFFGAPLYKLQHIEKELGRKFLPSSFSYGRSSAAKSLVCEVLSDILLVSG